MAELVINDKTYNLNFKFKNFINYRNLFNADFFTDIEYLFQKNLNFIRDLPSDIQEKFLNQKEQTPLLLGKYLFCFHIVYIINNKNRHSAFLHW